MLLSTWSLLVFVPWLGALIYIIARGRSMTARQMAAASQRQAEQDRYIKQVANTSQAPVDQIASAQALLSSGAARSAAGAWDRRSGSDPRRSDPWEDASHRVA